MKTKTLSFVKKTVLAGIFAALAVSPVAVAQSAELSTQCSALKTAQKGNAILAKQLAEQMQEAEKAEDFERVEKIMEDSARLATMESGLLFASIICSKSALKQTAEEVGFAEDEKESLTEQRTSSNCHALIEAASNGQAEVVKKLLLQGANPDAENKYGISAREAADINGDHATQRAMLGVYGDDEVCK